MVHEEQFYTHAANSAGSAYQNYFSDHDRGFIKSRQVVPEAAPCPVEQVKLDEKISHIEDCVNNKKK